MNGITASSDASRTWIRLIACSVFLFGLAVVQDPGLLVPDTKFDLVEAPREFLARALHLWDGEAAFGQVQNQAYGYLWPMGPFFLLGDFLGLPGWFIQRAWLGLILVVAFVGVARLSRALGVRSDLACILAGFAYALSPRMLSVLGPISIEAWPSAVAPWVLLPLVVGGTRSSPRRAAALSGLAVAMVGGVNAAATFAVLPLGAVWLVTRSAGPRRRSLMAWWPIFTVLGTLWWLVPLFVLGSYSPPFLDYIESAGVTTFPTTLFDALRGTSNWVPYLDPASRAGNDLLRQPALIVESGLLLLLGLAGIALRGHPHRLFLAVGTLLGLFLVTMGHTGSVEGLAAGNLNSLLDGALAPLRNVHKFDPVIRLCLTLGLALFVDARISSLRASANRDAAGRPDATTRANAAILVGAAVLGVTGAALPVAAERLTPGGAVVSVPDYWRDAATWLGDAEPGTTLLLPGSSFGTYVWGSPRDEPMQWLAQSRWAVRNAVPLAPPGNIRMLDEVERRINSGAGSPALASYLRRAGVRYLLIRNDLARGADASDPVLVHQALRDTPELLRVASFGPPVGGEGHLDDDDLGRLLINGGWQDEYPALEIYAVPGSQTTVPSSDGVPVVVGGPEDLADLAEFGILDGEPTVLAIDKSTTNGEPTLDGPVLLTDGLRATERSFGRVHDGRSATLVAAEQRRLTNPTRDYRLDGDERWSTWAVHEGAELTASSSASDANNAGPAQPGRLPYAAIDPWDETEWRSNITDEPAWWRADFPETRAVDTIQVRAGSQDREIVRIRTENTLSEPLVLGPSGRRSIGVDDPATSWVQVLDASDRAGHRLALADVEIADLEVTRALRLPEIPAQWGNPETISLSALHDARQGCVEIGSTVRCFPDREITDEEPLGFSRVVTLPGDAEYDEALVQVRARPGDDLWDLILQGGGRGISASSTATPDPRSGPVSAIDGNPGTAWSAALSDLRPTLELRFLGKQRLTGIQLSVDDDLAARLPTELLLRSPNGTRSLTLDRRGRATFAPLRTDRVDLVVREAEAANSLDFSSAGQQVPVGIGEVSFVGVPPNSIGQTPVTVPCGLGPVVRVNSVAHPTSVEALPGDLLRGSTIEAQLCGPNPIRLTAGENRVDFEPTTNLTPAALVLGDRGAASTARVSDVPIKRFVGGKREIAPSSGEVVAVPENINRGFRARAGGRDLAPLTIDGWQQGWRLNGTDEAVIVDYAPDRSYRIGLLLGLLTLIGLVGICLRPSRRWGSRDLPGLEHAAPGPIAVTALGLVAGALLGGVIGAAVAGAVFFVGGEVLKRQRDAGLPLIAAAMIPAVGAYVLRPWGGEAGWAGAYAWPHYLILAACVVPLAAAVRDHQGGRWSLRRMKGSSTAR